MTRHAAANLIRVSVCCLILAASGAASAEESTSAIMHKIYDAIAYLLPLSLRDPADATVWDAPLIEAKLASLNAASDALRQHTRRDSHEVKKIARSFDEMLDNVSVSFSNEWPIAAYFSTMDLIQHCAACHERLPAPSQALFGQRMIARMDIRDLPPDDVVKIHIAARAFDSALSTIEKVLMDPQLSPIEADYGSLLVDYLQIAISLKREPEIANTFLHAYLDRNDLPFYLRRRIEVWRSALNEFAPQLAAEPSLGNARAIFKRADTLSRGPGNRVRAAHDLIAASIIRERIANGPDLSSGELGEAYYMLGVVALRTLEPKSAVPEMELLLATSIELDPKGPFARKSFALIDEYGYVHENRLAADSATQSLVDMDALRSLLGL